MTDPNPQAPPPQVPPAPGAYPAAPGGAYPVAPGGAYPVAPGSGYPVAPGSNPYPAAPAPAYPGAASPAIPVPPAPPGAYGVPVGGYQAPLGGYAVPPTAPPASRSTGAIALIAALIAVLIVPIVAGVFGYQVGVLVPTADLTATTSQDLAFLAPARTQVLWAEIMFWIGTVLGIFAIVFGIIATAKRRGRGMGITAIVLSAIGPGIFFVVVMICLGIGTAVSVSGGL